MSLRCSKTNCSVLATTDQLAFYQDITNGGWNLGLGPEFVIPQLIPNIKLINDGNKHCPYTVICAKCSGKVGMVNVVCGFERLTVNFSAKKVLLFSTTAVASQKWSKAIAMFPQIRKITASFSSEQVQMGSDTIHFHGVADIEEMIKSGSEVANRSNLNPKPCQWRAFFFACLNNTLLCLPTGMGKTLIATMLMEAYHKRNISKGQVFVVPTIVLVEQQAAVIESHTGLKVHRRSGEHKLEIPWSAQDISVCTPAMFVNRIKMKQIDMSQLALIVLDEVHEANAERSSYGCVLPYIEKCRPSQRPRVLALTASPSGANPSEICQAIRTLCEKLVAVPYSPLVDDNKNTDRANEVTCQYIGISKSTFELQFEKIVFETLESLKKLHPFFETNWSHVNPNAETKQRVNSAIKDLSHSQIVARNNSDVQLLELTNWMKKWIGALDILQIFGPTKLISDIKADLEFAANNDALAGVLMSLRPLLHSMRRKIEQMEFDLPKDLPRVELLISQLKIHQADQERILIFVERRDTADRLCRRLAADPDIAQMNPEYIVGNSSGEFPKEMQQAILEKFHTGECRVLVATSVLEQGIDVTACGVVVCFDGVKSMKTIIQSRGRARKNKAKLVVFVTADQKRKTDELSNMEISMNLAIQQLMFQFKSKFDDQFSREMNKFIDTGREIVATEDEEYDDENDDYDEETDLPEDLSFFPLDFYNFTDSYALRDHISSNFNTKHDRVKVFKKKITAKFAVSLNSFWMEGTSIVQRISTNNGLEAAKNLRTQIHAPISPFEGHSELNVEFDCLTSFYFSSYSSVDVDANYIWNSRYTMVLRNSGIILKRSLEHFFIEPSDVEGIILINDNTKSYEIFLGLRIPPSFFVDDERSPFNFNDRSINLYLKKNDPVDPEQSWQINSLLMNYSLEVFNVCHLNQRTVSYRTEEEKLPDSFIENYLIRAWHNKYAGLLPPQLPPKVLNQFLSQGKLELLLEIVKPERFRPLEIPKVKDIQLPFNDESLKNYVMIGRAEITPSRIILKQMMPIQKNRVFRYFPNPENFIIVSFTDEHGSNPWRFGNIYNHFLNVLKTGVWIGDKQYTFLGCSNSQLREGRCWFSCLDRSMVYDKIGEFPETFIAGRKLTRLALAFAASVESIPVDHNLYLKNVSPDVEIGGINFSDGIGRASRIFFNEVKKTMNLEDPTVCALQIRIGGIKGVISVYDERDQDVTFRKSMKKFESSHNMLEVLNYNRPIPLYLNRHVILLLSSFEVPKEVFMDLQYNDLMTTLNALTDDDESLAFVKSRSKVFDWASLPKLRIVQEPFFRQLLISNMIDFMANIVEHAHISVSKGRVLMGVLDETNTLEYGEVYANIVEEGIGMELKGKVLVFRNPSVLPSDIRVLNAQSNVSPRLKKLYTNCLVLPSKGPQSHAHECSGGDLDGDLYYVIWDKKLIPDMEVPGDPLLEVEHQIEKSCDNDNSDDAMMQFYCNYVTNNRLGVIANAHLAMADKHGMRHPKAVTLARYVTAETDAPKKGLTVGNLPLELLPDEYPDYMMKIDKATYRSETVLGEMFRDSMPILEILLERRIISAPEKKINYAADKDSIEHFYALYSFEMKKLLNRFNLSSEVDLFSGTPAWQKGYMSAYKMETQLKQTVLDNVTEFWKTWKRIFEDWRAKSSNNQELIFQWFSRPKSSPTPVHSFSLLAMPFVEFKDCRPKTVIESIKESTCRWVYSKKMTWLHEWNLRYKAGQAVMQRLQGTECHFYGSSMLGLSEEYSDIDMFAADDNFERLREALKVIDKNAISMKKPHACVSLTYGSFPVDVTNFIDGVNKTYAFAEAFDENPGFWAALRVLVEWARNVKIVKSGGSEGLMTVVSFCHLFIHFSTSSPPKVQYTSKQYSLARFDSWITSMNNSPCGQLIFDFLKHLSIHKNNIWIASKTDPHNNEPLIKKDMISELSKSAEIAIFILSAHGGNVQKLFQFCSKKRLFRIDKRYMNPKTVSEREKKQCFKEIQSKCNPKKNKQLVFTMKERNGTFYLEVEGDHKCFPDVEQGLNKIQSRILCVRKGKWQTKAYHVIHATIIILEFGYGLNTEVKFSFYDSDKFMPQHTGKLKSTLIVRNVQKNLDWSLHEFKRYEKRFMDQLNMFETKQRQHRKDSRHYRFFGAMECTIRCGYHYLFNIPEALHNTFENVTLQEVERTISKLEEAFEKESEASKIQEQQNYNKETLISRPLEAAWKTDSAISLMPLNNQTKQKNTPLEAATTPTSLMSLNDLKEKVLRQKDTAVTNASVKKNSGGIRHSFYPDWTHDRETARKFAFENGFNEIEVDNSDHYTNISLVWRQRELVASCDRYGMLKEIKHRPSRWISATFKSCSGDGKDVRTYLKTRAQLDDDESCLDTVIDYLNGRSVFKDDYNLQIKHNSDSSKEPIPFTTRPLVSEMFQLNWRFNSMRLITPVMKFKNTEGDVLLLQKIHDGIFRLDTREFEWFPVHQEFEARLNMKRENSELCKKSYEMSLKLFDLTKK